MGRSTATLVILSICTIGYAAGLFFIEPIEYEIQDTYGLTMEQLEVKCDGKDKSLFAKIIADQDESNDVRTQLIQELVEKAKDEKGEIANYDWDKWDEWTREICFPNKVLKEILTSAISKVQQCVDQKDQLNEEGKNRIQRNLFKSFCDKVKVSAEWSYRSSRLRNC